MGVTWVLMFWTGEGGGGNLGPDVLDWGGVTWVLMFWTGEGGGGNLGPDVLDWGGGWG